MGLDKGLRTGLQYIADYAHCFQKAVRHAKPDNLAEIIHDFDNVWEKWLKELATVEGAVDVHGNIQNALLVALVIGDPFAGSREMVKALKTKYGVV